MAKHIKKRSFFNRRKDSNNDGVNTGSESSNISDSEEKKEEPDLNIISSKTESRQGPKDKNYKYILPVILFLVIGILSWSWVLLINPNISNIAEPFISKYFSGLLDRNGQAQTSGNNFVGTTEKEQAESESTENNVNAESSTDDRDEEESDSAQKRPTIQLKIYEGPVYDSSKQNCYYKVKAVVTGDPKPEVQFSRDDSKGALGKYETQINLKAAEKSYVLTATASNKNGNAMDSLTLSCSGNSSPVISEIKLSSDIVYVSRQYEITVTASDPDKDNLTYKWTVGGGSLDSDSSQTVKWNTPSQPENYEVKVEVTDSKGAKSSKVISVYVGSQQAPETTSPATTEPPATTTETSTPATTAPSTTTTEPEYTLVTVPINTEEGGYLEYGGQVYNGGNIYAGDSSTNKPCAGFISFDISSLSGKTIKSATFKLSSAAVYGNPLDYVDAFWINIVSWGSRPIVQDDFNLTGTAVQSFAASSVTCTADKLKTELQKALTQGKPRFQIRVHFSGPYTDNDDNRDGWEYLQTNVSLKIEAK